MKRRMILFGWILALALLTSGCGQDTPPVSGQIEPNPTTQAETTAPPEQTEATVPETTQAPEPTQSETVSLGRMEGGTYTNAYAGYGCQLDESWVYYGADELQALPDNVKQMLEGSEIGEGISQLTQIMDMQAENADLLATVNVLYTQLGLQERLAYLLLSEEEIVDAILQQKDLLLESYTQMGLDVTSIEKVPVTFLGEQHYAMKTLATAQGVPYYTLQIMDYTAGPYGVTLSVGSFVEDKTEQLLELFYPVEE